MFDGSGVSRGKIGYKGRGLLPSLRESMEASLAAGADPLDVTFLRSDALERKRRNSAVERE